MKRDSNVLGTAELVDDGDRTALSLKDSLILAVATGGSVEVDGDNTALGLKDSSVFSSIADSVCSSSGIGVSGTGAGDCISHEHVISGNCCTIVHYIVFSELGTWKYTGKMLVILRKGELHRDHGSYAQTQRARSIHT